MYHSRMAGAIVRSDRWPLEATPEQRQFMQYTVASLKLWDGREWLWHDVRIKVVLHRHLLRITKSPSLIAEPRCHLSVPVQIKPERLPHSERVCAVDLGINTLATASVVAQNGTVAQRRLS